MNLCLFDLRVKINISQQVAPESPQKSHFSGRKKEIMVFFFTRWIEFKHQKLYFLELDNNLSLSFLRFYVGISCWIEHEIGRRTALSWEDGRRD